MAFTQKEFNKLRDDITNAFHSNNDLRDHYRISKSSYKWSSKNDWVIIVDARYNNNIKDPIKKIEIVKLLLDTARDFITKDSRDFVFSGFGSNKASFSFSFVFQLKKDKVKKMLVNSG